MASRRTGVAAVLGVVAAVAASGHAGAVTPARPIRTFMPKTVLELYAPEVAAPLLSQLRASLMIPYRYTGSRTLTFSLIHGPAGMAVEERSGLVQWTPPGSADGTATDVRVRASDGVLAGEVAFTLEVAATQPLAVSRAASTVTITAPGTLAGVSFSLPAGASAPPAAVNAALVASADAPALPAGFTRVSDFFRLSPVVSREAPIVVTAPGRLVPAGRLPERLRLMVRTARALDVDGSLWIPTWTGLDVLPSGAVTFEAGTLGELSCFAVADDVETAAAAVADAALGVHGTSSAADRLAAATTCAPLRLAKGTMDSSRLLCSVGGDPPLTIVIKNLSANRWQPSPTAEELAGWLGAARQCLAALRMGSDERFEVVVETMRSNWLGFASSAERYRVLHLTPAEKAKTLMQVTAAHEYFHHAQSRTTVAGLNSLVWDADEQADWLIEGTAQWFEDVAFDDLDSYRLTENEPFPAVLGAGLDAVPAEKEDRRTRAYSRFAFFKLLASRCPGLDLSSALNTDLAYDPTGLGALDSSLAPWGCAFAAGLAGVGGDSLAAALLEYAYATIGQNSMAWLDDDEPSFSFDDPTTTLYAEKSCTAAGDCPWWAGRQVSVPRAGVRSFRIAPVEPLPTGTKAVIQLHTVTGLPTRAWIGNDETGSLETGRWYTVSGTVTHVYGGTRAPRMLVLLVNDDTFGDAKVEIRARLQSTTPADVVTPFDFAWSYAPVDPIYEAAIRNHVTWSAAASGSVTAPETATVGPATLPWTAANTKVVRVCAPNSAAFTLRMSATLQAATEQPSGRIPHPTIPQSWLNWQYSNPHLKIFLDDPSGSISGDTISFTIPVVKNAWFGRTYGGCVAHRLETWTTDKDGKDGPHTVAEEECQGSLLLDLHVGAPPDGCS